MIPLVSKPLPDDIQDILDGLQAKVNAKTTFSEKAKEAKVLWNTKGSKVGKEAFVKLRDSLNSMCVYVGVCNYCEQNEANDIEHVYPKSFFPEHAFLWDNYLLACKQCNTAWKLDKCFVLDEQGEVVEVNRGNAPAYNAVAFLNPRLEGDNSNNYMLLNLKTFKFTLLPNLNTIEKNKAEKTLEILQLNERDTLLAARESAYIHYYDNLKLLTHILKTNSKDEIADLLRPNEDRLDLDVPIETLKESIKQSYKKYFEKHQHPSVWHSIKIIDSKMVPKWQQLFAALPEALDWA